MYSIKEAAEKSGLTAHTLRYYTAKGLLPTVQRDQNNNRVFTEDDLAFIHFVKCLKNAGMPLKTIEYYMNLVVEGDQTVAERLELLAATRELVLEQQQKIAEELETIDWKMKNYKRILTMKGD